MLSHLDAGAVLDDRFAIEARVAEGGMAVVYRARDLATEDVVAVKILHATTSRFAIPPIVSATRPRRAAAPRRLSAI